MDMSRLSVGSPFRGLRYGGMSARGNSRFLAVRFPSFLVETGKTPGLFRRIVHGARGPAERFRVAIATGAKKALGASRGPVGEYCSWKVRS